MRRRRKGGKSGVWNAWLGDSGLYVGACPDCDVTLDQTHAEFNDVATPARTPAATW
jgi:hypothetical protein